MGDKLRLLCIKRPLYDVNCVLEALGLCLEDAPHDNWSKKIGISKKERKHSIYFASCLLKKDLPCLRIASFQMSKD